MKIYLKSYLGYANEEQIVVFGHVFKNASPDQYPMNTNGLKYALQVLKVFSLDTVANCEVKFSFNGRTCTTATEEDGYFQFNVDYSDSIQSGWHECTLKIETEDHEITETGRFLKPHPGEFGLISDIDDTFIVSHSNSIFMKLYVILTKNISQRTSFPDVVRHYQLLSNAGRDQSEYKNVFFYVSSSEWNLYNFLSGFTEKNKFPRAIMILRKIKTGLSDFMNTGGGSHSHKFEKIEKIISFYPKLTFVLFGDDSQQDPYIYHEIATSFQDRIKVIYIRQTASHQKESVLEIMNQLRSTKTKMFYYRDSKDAIAHSKEIGLIN